MILLQRRGWAALLPRLALGAVQRVRRIIWMFTRPRTTGARGICLDRESRLILVRHSYVRGWFLPGGAPKAGEPLSDALLRELREELGMIGYGAVTRFFEVEQHASGKRDRQTVFLVEGVSFVPRLSLEIEAVAAFALDQLPEELHPSTSYKLERWQNLDRNWSGILVPDEG